MRNPSQVLLLAVLVATLILPPGLPLEAAAASNAAGRSAKSVLLVGDSLSIGLGKQLDAAFASRPDLSFAHLGKVSSGLANPAFFDWNVNLANQVAAHHPDVVLVMLGANDDKPLPLPEGRSAAFGSRDWDAAYAGRVSRLHSIARAGNPPAFVYFVGVPVMGDAGFNQQMAHIDGVLHKTAGRLQSCSFVDVKGVLADATGAYAPVARTSGGDIVRLRADDGVHITPAGAKLLAARLIEAVAEASGLPRDELLASLENRDLTPLAAAPAAAPVSVQLASLRHTDIPAVHGQKTEGLRPVPGGKSYPVADGDTLWSVAKRLGVSADALAAANPGVDPRRLSIGQLLAVPAEAGMTAAAKAPAASRPAPGLRQHAVAEGDNFWSVARRYSVSVAALTQANPGVEPTRLRIGQPLAIPAGHPALAEDRSQAPAAPGQGYVVADGDNLWSIAKRLGVDVAELKRANAAVNPLKLQPGQILALPGGAQAEGVAPAGRRDSRIVGDAGLYPVAKGDTLWALSRRFGVTLEDLVSLNGELDPSRLQVGQLVTVPGNQAAAAPSGRPVASAESLVFPVSAGDTLWGIARRFDVSVEALLAANPGVDPLRLREGQTLQVPSSLAAVATPATLPAAAATPAQAPARPAAPAGVPEPAQTPVIGVAPGQAAPVQGVAQPSVAEPARQHTVSAGDSIWKLSRRYGVSVAGILAENAGLSPNRLQVGQTLRLPGVVSMAAR